MHSHNSIQMRRGRSILFIAIPVLAGVVMVSGCSGNKDASAKAANEDARLVKTEILESRLVEQQNVFAGTVEPFEQAFISSSTPVRIKTIFKEVGDFVRKGDLLVQMDASNYLQAKAQLDHLELEYARLDTLFRVGSIAQQQLDQMATQLDVARTSFENLMENTQLRSPINGVVTARYFENGEMFSLSPLAEGRSAILTIMTINPVKVIISLPEEFFPKVDKQMAVTMELDSYPDKEFKGSLFLRYPTIDPITRTFMVELQFPNPSLTIRPGMFGRVTLGLGSSERVMAPDIAVLRQTGTNDRYVFVVENGHAVRKIVKTGRLIDNYFEILEGVIPGEEVVTAGFSGLLDEMPVIVTR